MTKRSAVWFQAVLVGLVALAPLDSTRGQSSSTSGDSFVIKGVAADANGPLAGKVVVVMPIEEGRGPVIRYRGASATLGTEEIIGASTEQWTYRYKFTPDPRFGQLLNPQTTTDAKGAFSATVPRSLFKEHPECAYGCATFKTGALGVGVFDGSVSTFLVSTFEVKTITYDPSTASVDAGRLVLEPARKPTK